MLAGFFVALLSGHIYILIICKSHLGPASPLESCAGWFRSAKARVSLQLNTLL